MAPAPLNLNLRKIMKNTILFFLLFILLFTGICNCSLDYDRNLGDGYFINGYGVTTVIYKKINNKEDDEILLGEIVEYKFNSNFILIYRVVTKEVKKFNNDHYLSEIMRGGDSIQYWIINKKKNIIIGPLRKNEYLLKCKNLNIPNNIQLEKITKNTIP
jgi:hypothetical protein